MILRCLHHASVYEPGIHVLNVLILWANSTGISAWAIKKSVPTEVCQPNSVVWDYVTHRVTLMSGHMLTIFVLNALTGTCVEAWACKILICCRFRWHGCDFNPKSCWRHQMETFSALLALCAGNSRVTCDFPSQTAVTRSFDVFFDKRLDKRLSKQSRRWGFETLSSPLWRHCNDVRS